MTTTERNKIESERRRPFIEKKVAAKLKELAVTQPFERKSDCPHCAFAAARGQVIWCGVCGK